MPRVRRDVSHRDLEGDNGRDVAGVVVTCGKCGHEEKSFGTSDRSVNRCLVLLRDNCPLGERNFYEED